MMHSLKPAGILSEGSSFFTGLFKLLLIWGILVDGMATSGQTARQNQWFISGSTGIALRGPGFSGKSHPVEESFRHQPGFAFDLSFGKNFGNKVEPVIRWGAYTFFGESDQPHYSAVGYYVAYPGMLRQQPLKYVTQGNALSLILRYIFINSSSRGRLPWSVRPLIEAGLGINNYVTEVRYSKIPAGESGSLIFRNRNGGKSDGSGIIITGAGLRIGTPGEWNGLILLNAEWAGYTSLSTVSQRIDPLRNSSRSLVTRLTAGITIPVKRTVRKDNYLPFRW